MGLSTRGRLPLVGMLLVVMALVAAACGGDETEGTSPSPSAGAASKGSRSSSG